MGADSEEATPSDNLYVTDLPADTTEELLRNMFGPGVSQCRVLPSKTPGQGSVAALVRFTSMKEAMLVRETLNGAIPPGQSKAVTIRFSNSQRSSPYGGGAQQAGPRLPNDNLYITGLPPNIDVESVRQLFGQYGTVVQCKVLPAPNENAPRHALVRFTSADEAAAVKKNLAGYALEGVNEPLVVEFAIKKEYYSGGNEYGKAGKGSWDAGQADWGGKGAGKGKSNGGMAYGGMEAVLQGFLEAQCLPGHELGNDDNCLYIAGLPRDCDDVHLYRLLAPFGPIPPMGVKAMKHPDGACKGFGFVNFINPADMAAASTMLNGTQLPDGNTISVIPKKPGKGSTKGS